MSIGGTLFVTYTYDDAGRLETITRGSHVFQFAYDNMSRRTTLTFPNGVVTTYSYDSLSRLTDVTAALGPTVIAQSAYTYDDAGNRLTKTTEAFTEVYTYDDVYRMTSVTRDFVPTETYTYDAVGNRLTSINHSNWTYNERNELLSKNGTTLEYDGNGNVSDFVQANRDWSYEWDVWNQLWKVTESVSGKDVKFDYDPLSHRLRQKTDTSGLKHTYTYSGMDLITEKLKQGGTVVEKLQYIHGPGIDEPLAVEDGAGTLSFYHADGLGSIVEVTNMAGDVIDSYDYKAFGQIQDEVGEEGYAFTGRRWDPESKLYYYRARFYRPGIGRFLSEDPIGPIQQPDAKTPVYSYVANNPLRYKDPLGLFVMPPLPVTTLMCSQGLRIADGLLIWLRQQEGSPDKLAHCLAHCYLTRYCGNSVPSILLDYGKEAYDEAKGWVFRDGSEWDSFDQAANRRGRECPATRTCWENCSTADRDFRPPRQ